MKILMVSLSILITFSLFGKLTDYQAAYSKSFTLESAKEYKKALKVLEEIYPKYKYDYELNLRLGWLSYKSGKYEDSVKYLKEAISLKDGAIEPKNMILLPLTALKKWKMVEKYGFLVVKQSSSNYYAHIRLAYSYYIQKKYKKAIYHYKILNTYYPSDNSPKLGLAASYLASGDIEKSYLFYIDILKTDPYNSIAYAGYLKTKK